MAACASPRRPRSRCRSRCPTGPAAPATASTATAPSGSQRARPGRRAAAAAAATPAATSPRTSHTFHSKPSVVMKGMAAAKSATMPARSPGCATRRRRRPGCGRARRPATTASTDAVPRASTAPAPLAEPASGCQTHQTMPVAIAHEQRRDRPRGGRRAGGRRPTTGRGAPARRPAPADDWAAWKTVAPKASAASSRSRLQDAAARAAGRAARRRRGRPARRRPPRRSAAAGDSWSRLAATSQMRPTPTNTAPSARSSRPREKRRVSSRCGSARRWRPPGRRRGCRRDCQSSSSPRSQASWLEVAPRRWSCGSRWGVEVLMGSAWPARTVRHMSTESRSGGPFGPCRPVRPTRQADRGRPVRRPGGSPP